MDKQIGLFSDIHGSWSNLEAIVKVFEKEGVKSTFFMGDALYETMGQFTIHQSQISQALKEQLRQESPIRNDILNGLFSNKQLQIFEEQYKNNKRLSKKIAKKEYETMKNILGNIDTIILGGNWDYTTEIQEVFKNSYINAQSKEIEGIKVTGFSGSGSGVGLNFSEESLADNQRDEKYQFREWGKAFKDDIISDIFISHLPFTDGEGVTKENGVEQLKSLYMNANMQDKNIPNILVSGHRHDQGDVKYDSELDAFIIRPGASSDNHNDSASPTFMIANFGNDNIIKSVNKYEIKSNIEGLKEVIMTSKYIINYKNKTVTKNKINTPIIEKINIPDLISNLQIDKNWCIDKLDLNYSNLNIQEKDIQLRKNISAMFTIGKQQENEIKKATRKCNPKYIKKDKFDLGFYFEITKHLSDAALKKYGANLDNIDKENQDLIKEVFIQAAYGISGSDIINILKESQANKIEEIASQIGQTSASNVQKKVQEKIFNTDERNSLTTKDFQEMAELYIPQNFKANGKIGNKAINLWIDTFQKGLLSSKDMEKYSQYYKKTTSYEVNKKNKTNLEDMFDFKYESKYVNELPHELLEKLKKMQNLQENTELPPIESFKTKDSKTGEYRPINLEEYKNITPDQIQPLNQADLDLDKNKLNPDIIRSTIKKPNNITI